MIMTFEWANSLPNLAKVIARNATIDRVYFTTGGGIERPPNTGQHHM